MTSASAIGSSRHGSRRLFRSSHRLSVAPIGRGRPSGPRGTVVVVVVVVVVATAFWAADQLSYGAPARCRGRYGSDA